MEMMRKRRRTWSPILVTVVILAVLLWFFAAMGNLNRDSGDEQRRQLENALRRSAVACYAAEGVYPPNLDYLTEHYGVQIEDEYIVFYEIFASNLMPDITVIEKGVS